MAAYYKSQLLWFVYLLVFLRLLVCLPVLHVFLGGFDVFPHGGHDLDNHSPQGKHDAVHEAWLHLGDVGGRAVAQEGDRERQRGLSVSLVEEFVVEKVSPLMDKVEGAGLLAYVTGV